VRPRIGITTPLPFASFEEMVGQEARRHVKLLESLGAETLLLARGDATANALERHDLNGSLFSGGGDVAATLYGGRPELCWDRVDLERDNGELSLLRKVFARRVPALCICRGMQLANVAFGGTLIEDIKTELGGRYSVPHHQVRELDKFPSEHTHEVRLADGSALAKILGTQRPATNSIHHQAIGTLAAPFRASGRTDDGIIEAIELAAPDFFFFGVQWHPESLPADDASTRLYSAFVSAASKALLPESGMHGQ
jgi:gamma-glutamyl-gamma-aminobutyrate hydrolase PuuD